jgi:hypothetical protein
MTTTNETLVRLDCIGRIRFSRAQREGLLNAYESSGLSGPQFDETPIDYLQPGTGAAQTGYLWTSNIPHGTVMYHWRAGRDAGGVVELFGDTCDSRAPRPACVIQCDGYGAYPAWAKDKPEITLMGCHAHVRRKFYEARDQAPRLVTWILHQLGHLYRIEKTLREAKAGPALRPRLPKPDDPPTSQKAF